MKIEWFLTVRFNHLTEYLTLREYGKNKKRSRVTSLFL